MRLAVVQCESDLCQNGGTCVVVNGKAVCQCPGNFGGPICEGEEISR